ncbi:MAG: nucleotidyltransferase domain-containing protein [Lachnospiraceae bacterium]|nr:nucleotidyltransferase domain-containing protein [Lachnospiraceae bacterium]
MKLNDIITILKQVYSKYDNIRLGIAGSYANSTQKPSSDIDIVIEGDSMRVDIMEYIKSLFDITVDVLWVDLMKKEDDELDRFAIENGLPINKYSVYKTVMQEVRWI